MMDDLPDGKIVEKPWGSEYKIHYNNESSTKLLEIKANQKTSLHCHPIKKTGFILLKGSVIVDLGFYEKVNLKSVSKLMIRPGLFHCTQNNTNQSSFILEIESPVDINDLVRFKDNYGREDKPYESRQFMSDISKKDIIFKDPKIGESSKYNLFDNEIIIMKTDNIEDLKNSKKNNIFVILGGGLSSEDNKMVLSPADIVRTDTINKLADRFKINNYISFLKLKYE